jgi:aspartate/methionine/tyrosine aminotransferase
MDTGSPAPISRVALRPEAGEAPESGIVEVFNYGRGRPRLIPLWAGEGDLPTPGFIADAAARSLADGETFYTNQRGVPELRAALARYHERTFGGAFAPDRFSVTCGGMHAIQMAVRMVAGIGDEVVVPGPSWPNLTAAVGVAGARPVAVPMTFGNAGWTLDLDRLFDAVTDRTSAIFINSPANPTGWTATRRELAAIAEFAAARGLWIIADEVYHRFFYEGPRAASFYDVADRDQPILYVNTFSKNYAMTGWRIGWLSAPAELGQTIENLIQYSTSGVATFMQRAATAALDDGDDFIASQTRRAAEGRRIVCSGLAATGRVRMAEPAGAFYLFFAIDGQAKARELALRLVDEANIGLAPGTAFGDQTGFMRLCFARSGGQLEEAIGRLVDWLHRN